MPAVAPFESEELEDVPESRRGGMVMSRLMVAVDAARVVVTPELVTVTPADPGAVVEGASVEETPADSERAMLDVERMVARVPVLVASPEVACVEDGAPGVAVGAMDENSDEEMELEAVVVDKAKKLMVQMK
jgi:hypothetical protein